MRASSLVRPFPRLAVSLLVLAPLLARPAAAAWPEPAPPLPGEPRVEAVPSDERRAPGACTQPAKPTLTSSVTSAALNQTFELSWTPDPVISPTYQIGWSYTGGAVQFTGSFPQTSVNMTITSGVVGQVYTYFVRSKDPSCALYTDSNTVNVTLVSGSGSCQAPPAPTLAVDKPNPAVNTTYTLSWPADATGKTDHFWVGVSTSASGTYSEVAELPPTTTSLTLTASMANAGATLYYKVWAYPHGGSACESYRTASAAVAVTIGGSSATCTPDSTHLCLYGGRFRVSATYKDYSQNTGNAKAVALTADSGYFWFFSQTNVELVAKIVSFCSGSTGGYGLYVSGLTDVEVVFTVTDTKKSITRTYPNALGNRFCTVGDEWKVCP